MTSFSKIFKSTLLSTLVFACSFTTAYGSEASLQFVPDTVSTGLSSKFKVSIMVDTSGYAAGGVGTIITYDPFMLTPLSIVPGKIFTDYPISSINSQLGKITISGIAASPDSLFTGSGEFAVITFKPNQLGSTALDFVFKPGSTTDSNIAVTFGTGDILAKVNKLNVSVVTDAIQAATATSEPTALPSLGTATAYFSTIGQSIDQFIASLDLPFMRDKYASARSGRVVSKKLSPLAPLVAQASITDPYNRQPIASVNQVATATSDVLKITVILGIAVAILGVIFVLYKISKSKPVQS